MTAVEIVARALDEHLLIRTPLQNVRALEYACTCRQWSAPIEDDEAREDYDAHRAQAITDALAEAGLLLPEGGKVRTEYGTRHAGSRDAYARRSAHDATISAQRDGNALEAVQRMITAWPDGSELVTAWVVIWP